MSVAYALGCGLGTPNTIDVSGYPPDMQQRYALFVHKCSRCHALARPIDAHVGKAGWSSYVARMSRVPGAGISADEQREIAAFLEYHSMRQAEKQR